MHSNPGWRQDQHFSHRSVHARCGLCGRPCGAAGEILVSRGYASHRSVASYKDLLPEPALQYGEIIRLSLPDFARKCRALMWRRRWPIRRKLRQFSALDTVADFRALRLRESSGGVSVLGDVRSPGTYPDIRRYSSQRRDSSGRRAHARRGYRDAQVFRYMPDSTLKILNVKLDSALDGSPADNIAPTPRDRVLMHKNRGSQRSSNGLCKGESGPAGTLSADRADADLRSDSRSGWAEAECRP